MSKRPSFIQPFGRQHVNGSKTRLRSIRNQFHTTLPLIWERRSTKRLVLVRSKFFGQFVNTLPPDYKYSRKNRENLWQQLPKHIYRKLKTLFGLFIAFLKSTLNLEYLERKDLSHSLSITEIVNCETGSYLNVQKVIFHVRLRQTTC